MRYVFAAQTYWPIWLTFAAYGYSALGMIAGAACAATLMRIFWVNEFSEVIDEH